MDPVPYTIADDDLELLLRAIERYCKVTTMAEFEKARLYATGVNLRLLRVRQDLDRELWQVYLDACLRLGINADVTDDFHQAEADRESGPRCWSSRLA